MSSLLARFSTTAGEDLTYCGRGIVARRMNRAGEEIILYISEEILSLHIINVRDGPRHPGQGLIWEVIG